MFISVVDLHLLQLCLRIYSVLYMHIGLVSALKCFFKAIRFFHCFVFVFVFPVLLIFFFCFPPHLW